MAPEVWENVVQIGKAFKANRPTDCPIQRSPEGTIDVYSNILPTKQPPKQQQQQQQQSPPPQQLQQHTPQRLPNLMSSGLQQQQIYNNAMFHPNMMYGNMIPPHSNPMMFNQPNYVNVMAAAQSIMNSAAVYNNMLMSNYNPHQQLMSPQPHQQMMPSQPQQQIVSPRPQHMLSPQQQHASMMPNTQIRRKPVQVQPANNSYLSPQIKQRLLRKKSVPQQHQQYVSAAEPPLHNEPVKPKKQVRFSKEPQWYIYERMDSGDEDDDDDENEQQDYGHEQPDQHDYYEDNNEPQHYHKSMIYDNEEDDHNQYYTQQSNHHSYSQPGSSNSSGGGGDRYGYYYRSNEPEEEEDHGDLWKRRSFIRRHNSKYKSRV